jgi:hypothetical protein
MGFRLDFTQALSLVPAKAAPPASIIHSRLRII